MQTVGRTRDDAGVDCKGAFCACEGEDVLLGDLDLAHQLCAAHDHRLGGRTGRDGRCPRCRGLGLGLGCCRGDRSLGLGHRELWRVLLRCCCFGTAGCCTCGCCTRGRAGRGHCRLGREGRAVGAVVVHQTPRHRVRELGPVRLHEFRDCLCVCARTNSEAQ